MQPQVPAMASRDTPFLPDLHLVPATRCSAPERGRVRAANLLAAAVDPCFTSATRIF
jgi:hypothetical protein